ncbi:MAG TPA: IspD/TarI family cytidylyltransferase, partial [Novosphingobium sp.]|nr:IspD/TarI family cytidylyltransferase [Novosphingobium sp.]
MPESPPPAAAIVVAAGQGLRAGGATPKQFVPWRGKPMVRHSVEALIGADLAPIVVAVAPDAIAHAATLLEGTGARIVAGGETRRQSVANALEALAADAPRAVLIHDAARPGLQTAVIGRLIAALETAPGAIPVLPVVDSLHREGEGRVERERLHRVQTPQAFRFAEILAAHRAWPKGADA